MIDRFSSHTVCQVPLKHPSGTWCPEEVSVHCQTSGSLTAVSLRQGARAGYPESMLLREMAFGLLNASVQATVSAYRFSSLPHAVCLPCHQRAIAKITKIIGKALSWHDHDGSPSGSQCNMLVISLLHRLFPGLLSSALLGIWSVHRHERRQYADS